ncbi:MAG TPA: hypothetical protein VNQ15_11390, partial [Verrucomicrobiae bacterium]|nr:hypothetical protein [Verrucomicrobiae bacterium]
AEHLHPHMTIAEFCRSQFADVWKSVQPRERRFAAQFDNITILRQVGEEDGIDLWAIHRSLNLRS